MSELSSTMYTHMRTCRVEGGELFDRVVSIGKFSEAQAKLLFYQMLQAVNVSARHHCHSTVVHENE